MYKIYKFTLAIEDEQTVMLPLSARTLSVQFQEGVPGLALWALLDVTEPPVPRHIRILGTGHPFDDYKILEFQSIDGPVKVPNYRYIGTVQEEALVWHVFEDFNWQDVLG